MKLKRLTLAVGLAFGSPTLTLADPMEQRLARVEAMMAEMRKRLAAQEAIIEQQAATITDQKAELEGMPPRLQKLVESLDEQRASQDEAQAWYRSIEVAGLVEVEGAYRWPYVGDDESDFALATFELGIAAQLTDWVEVGASLLYEEDDTPLEVDVAFVTLANSEEAPGFVTAGQIYVPFGAYETNMLSDPLTLEIGETRETAVQTGFVLDRLNGSLYAFNGDNEKDGQNAIRGWGANVGYVQELDHGAIAAGVGYLSDLGDSDALQDLINDNLGDNDTDRVGAWTVNAAGRFGPFTLIGEYLAAAESFDAPAVPWRGGGGKPKAWNLELGYDFDMFRKAATVAVGYQGTSEALALELPKERILAALSVEIYDSTALSFEWAHDKDYSKGDGGTGKDADTITAQLAIEF